MNKDKIKGKVYTKRVMYNQKALKYIIALYICIYALLLVGFKFSTATIIIIVIMAIDGFLTWAKFGAQFNWRFLGK